MKILFIAVSFLVLFSYIANAEETNNCHDEAVNQQWEQLAQNNPHDMDMASLHALRIGLYLKVERGDLTVSQATKIFENVRLQFIGKKERENLEAEKNGKAEL